VQQLIDRLTAAASKPNGEMVSATQHDIAEVILQRAKALDVASSCSVTSTIAAQGICSRPVSPCAAFSYAQQVESLTSLCRAIRPRSLQRTLTRNVCVQERSASFHVRRPALVDP
jgi:hypothetical protein